MKKTPKAPQKVVEKEITSVQKETITEKEKPTTTQKTEAIIKLQETIPEVPITTIQEEIKTIEEQLATFEKPTVEETITKEIIQENVSSYSSTDTKNRLKQSRLLKK